jgi:hypothetical protein
MTALLRHRNALDSELRMQCRLNRAFPHVSQGEAWSRQSTLYSAWKMKYTPPPHAV